MGKQVYVIILLLLCLCNNAHAQDYGANEANSKFYQNSNTLGGKEDYDYMSLYNHPDKSGVPLGGIGAGNVNFTPSGAFNRIGINNIHMPIKHSDGSFFSVWVNDNKDKKVFKLVQKDRIKGSKMDGVEVVKYKGLFPFAELDFEDKELPIDIKIKAHSSLVPHNLKDSSLPVVWFTVELESKKDCDVSVALSWEDFIGCYRDCGKVEGMDGQIIGERRKIFNGEKWGMPPKIETFAQNYSGNGLVGVKQYVDKDIVPLRWTYQNYNNNVIIAAENKNNQIVSVLNSYSVKNEMKEWKDFIKDGIFIQEKNNVILTPCNSPSKASAVAVKVSLKANQKETIGFTLSWFAPEVKIDTATTSKDRYWKYNTDYSKYYHNYFKSIDDVLVYAMKNKDRLEKSSKEWQEPVLNSTLPDWYKFKLINSGYVIYTNITLNKRGDMMVNEGAMGGLAGTMDQRISSHPFYQKFFTELDRSEMNIFADAMDPEGYILHFIGHYYGGMGTIGGKVPTEKGHMLDNSSGWIIQLVKDFEQTGDIDYLKQHLWRVEKIMKYLSSCMPENCNIPVGATTYDDFVHPPVYSYYAGVWLATLKAYRQIGIALKRNDIVKYAEKQFDISQKEIIEKLWNGNFFSYGCEPDGSKSLDNILFTGQLAGQFLSRYCGWGDIYPWYMVQSSLEMQFKESLSKTPDFYANKVWDLNLGHGIDKKGSQCWPFYLESYTALAGMQAGYFDDAMDILRHIQLVHLRHGYTWTQNLWNPGEVTYMTAPVTWFSTDVLAGAGINVLDKELRLAPIVKGNNKTIYPLFYPKFWGQIEIDPIKKSIVFKITKLFDEKSNIEFTHVKSEHSGKSSLDYNMIEIPVFKVQEGSVLDLSDYYDQIVKSELKDRKLEYKYLYK